jgi:glutathione S-transferase
MHFDYPHAALATGLAILVSVWTGFVVGRARKLHGVDHPNTHGPDAFNRVWRAHQNTLEQIVIFLPSLWLFAIVVNELWAAVLGLTWAVGRVLYVRGYAIAAQKRAPGFAIAILSTAILLFGALGVTLWQLFSR